MLWLLGQALINGLLAGGIYALVAIGITIIFGVMKMVNFAMGTYLMLGMYATLVCYKIFKVNCYALIPFVIIIMAMVGYASFKTLMKPALSRGGQVPLLVTIGLSFVLQNLAQILFGASPQSVPSDIKSTFIPIGPFSVPLPRLIALGVASLMVVFINLVFNRTLLGRTMRATAENAEVAQILGVRTNIIFVIAFIMGISMAGLSGLLLTPLYFVTPTTGSIFRTFGIMTVVLGGLGSIKGALVGGLMIGITEALTGAFVDQNLGSLGVFILFLVVLYLKPRGLFGIGERVG